MKDSQDTIKAEFIKRKAYDLIAFNPSMPYFQAKEKAIKEWDSHTYNQRKTALKNFKQAKHVQVVQTEQVIKGEGKKARTQNQAEIQEQQIAPLDRPLDPKKKIKKFKAQYHQFHQFYFKRLKIQHTKWTSCQISAIIGLLWKKRKLKLKLEKREVLKKKNVVRTVNVKGTQIELPKQPRTAYHFFFQELKTKSPKIQSKEISALWKILHQDQRQKYKSMASKDTLRFYDEKAAFQQRHGFYPVQKKHPISWLGDEKQKQKISKRKRSNQNPLAKLLSMPMNFEEQEKENPISGLFKLKMND